MSSENRGSSFLCKSMRSSSLIPVPTCTGSAAAVGCASGEGEPEEEAGGGGTPVAAPVGQHSPPCRRRPSAWGRRCWVASPPRAPANTARLHRRACPGPTCGAHHTQVPHTRLLCCSGATVQGQQPSSPGAGGRHGAHQPPMMTQSRSMLSTSAAPTATVSALPCKSHPLCPAPGLPRLLAAAPPQPARSQSGFILTQLPERSLGTHALSSAFTTMPSSRSSVICGAGAGAAGSRQPVWACASALASRMSAPGPCGQGLPERLPPARGTSFSMSSMCSLVCPVRETSLPWMCVSSRSRGTTRPQMGLLSDSRTAARGGRHVGCGSEPGRQAGGRASRRAGGRAGRRALAASSRRQDSCRSLPARAGSAARTSLAAGRLAHHVSHQLLASLQRLSHDGLPLKQDDVKHKELDLEVLQQWTVVQLPSTGTLAAQQQHPAGRSGTRTTAGRASRHPGIRC